MFAVFLSLFACSSSTVITQGQASLAGNPAKFIELCISQDPTAIAIKESFATEDCESAGKSLSMIQIIDFNQAKIEKVNLQVLDSLSNIEQVAAYGKNIDDISPLAGLVRLKELYLMGNAIDNIDALSELHQLKYLRLDGNKIKDIRVLETLIKLEKVGLDSNLISDFTPLASLPALQDLNTNFNPVDLDKCPMGKGVTAKLDKYCSRMKKNAPDMQGAIDPK